MKPRVAGLLVDRGQADDCGIPMSGRCAVVFNPTKISDQFRGQLEKALLRDGWTDTLWLETSADDPGRAMTRQAVTAGVDRVIAAGGDGTVRIVADGLAGSGITMDLIPAGPATCWPGISICRWKKRPRSRWRSPVTRAPST